MNGLDGRRAKPTLSPTTSADGSPNPFFSMKQESSSTNPPHSPNWSSLMPSRSRSPVERRHKHHHSSASCSTPSESEPAQGYPLLNRPLSLPDSQSPSYSSFLRQPPRSTTWIDRNSSASLPLPSQIPFYSLPRVQATSRSSEGSVSTDSVPRCPSLEDSISSSSSSSSSRPSSFGRSESPVSSVAQDSCKPHTPHDLEEGIAVSQSDSFQQRPCSPQPFRAPRPPSPDDAFLSHIPEFTAMRRFMTPSQQASTLPPLEPPMILENTQSGASAPYAPFLSHAPAPPDCRIEIETTPSAYWLNVRLPGFTREGITLATKRRRILHVVADNWENGGGKFLVFFSSFIKPHISFFKAILNDVLCLVMMLI